MRVLEPIGMRGDISAIERVVVGEPRQQAAEKRNIAIGPHGKVHVGNVGGHGSARIDEHDLHVRAPLLCCGDALVKNGMAPGEVRADEDDQIGKLEVLVGAGHSVGAEGAPVSGNGGGHAEPRIGIDIGRADEAFHQLVGDIIIFGQQLAGNIQGDGVAAMRGDRLRKRRGDAIERRVPARPATMDLRMQQAVVEIDRLAECRAFRAEPAEIGRMLWIAAHVHAAVGRNAGDDPAPDAAIGTGGSRRRGLHLSGSPHRHVECDVKLFAVLPQ